MRHINGGGDFRLGIQLTSHIESIRKTLKGYIKKIKYIIRNKNNLEKIREIFEAFKLINNCAVCVDFKNSEFLYENKLNSEDDIKNYSDNE